MARFSVPLFLSFFAALSSGQSQTFQTVRPQARITRAIDENQLTKLSGSTHPLARAEFDQGAAPSDLPMDHMLLVLSRSADQESALQTLLAQQQDKSSPNYHQWLTPQQFGAKFGAADQDIQTITSWLESHGFTVNRVSNGKTVIDFSGTAAQVQQAFHSEIHKYVVNGQEHWANANDLSIPSALAPVLSGILTLHNFYKKPQFIRANQPFPFTYTAGSKPQFTSQPCSSTDISSCTFALAPADFATIYNINPLYQAEVNGTGTTIAVVAQSNITANDITTFRSMFNLPVNNPTIIVTNTCEFRFGCDDSGDAEEATLDASWAGAIAPNATVDLVVSYSTNASSGVDLSEVYIVDNNLADVMTESYGDCEQDGYSQADADYYSSLAEQAATEGITYTVAAGDSGAEGCDDPNSETIATGPISVNILAATPYNVAVGGTEFNENGNYSAYWSTTNSSNNASALSYIPEDVWNESCEGTTASPCTNGNTPGIWAGGGGSSIFFSKPTWQAGVAGIPNDNARDVPDVALTAAGHDFYLLCFQNSCTATRRSPASFEGVSGTSAPTPSFAGIMALVVQRTGSRQGQANYVLYPLAASESLSSCNASNTSGLPASNCIFNDVTVGNDAVPGEANYGTANAAYEATVGYDLASGLGSVNVANLVNNWSGAPVTSTSPFQITINQPSSLNSIFIGLASFSGSALRNNASITQVEISIDGVPYALAILNGSSWSQTVDTTQFADGTHTLDVTATSSLGDHATATASFTVANWSSSDPMVVDIDNPGANSGAFSGSVGFGGWAIDRAGSISNVLIYIDGVVYGDASYGFARPDVCANYSGVAACPNVGWNYLLDTTTLADGTHTLAVTGYTASGQNTTVTRTFTTANLSASPIGVFIDLPNAKSSPYSGAATFAGWAIDNNTGVAISSVAVSIDGTFLRNATYGVARPDVCTAFPGRAGCPNVGWDVVIDTTVLANGVHTLEVEAIAANGQHATTSAQFTVTNPTSGLALKMFIDVPGPQSSVVTGLTNFAGWALDDNAAISSVSISVDGVTQGNATYGASRADVCAAYPGRPRCPNVGWTLAVDTTVIPDGVHTAAATARAANGDTLTVSSTFTVANWTSGNPMRINIDMPNSQSGAFSGSAGLYGWAISDIAAIANVAISIDGVRYGNASYGLGRPDVCTAYPGRAGCPNVGWYFGLDTTLLANGTHKLDVTATSSEGQSSTVSTTFNVSNSSTALIVNIDTPSSAALLTGLTHIGGWAIDTTSGVAVTSVQISVDGALVGNATYGGSRPDVCAAYPTATCNGGWNYMLDTTLLSNGFHTLDVTAASSTGQHTTVSRSFSVEQ